MHCVVDTTWNPFLLWCLIWICSAIILLHLVGSQLPDWFACFKGIPFSLPAIGLGKGVCNIQPKSYNGNLMEAFMKKIALLLRKLQEDVGSLCFLSLPSYLYVMPANTADILQPKNETNIDYGSLLRWKKTWNLDIYNHLKNLFGKSPFIPLLVFYLE